MSPILNIAIYARVSTEDKGQELQTQVIPVEDWIKRNIPACHVTTYMDKASGKTLDRPKFREMMRDAEDRKIDIICVYKIDRISRSIQDFLGVARKLKEIPVRLVAVTQGIDTDINNPGHQMLTNILAVVAEFESTLISERVKAGIARRKREGKHVGPKKKIFDVVRAIELQRKGHSYRYIGMVFGLNAATVHRRIKEYLDEGRVEMVLSNPPIPNEAD